MDIQLFQNHLLSRLLFLHWIAFALWSKPIDHICVGLLLNYSHPLGELFWFPLYQRNIVRVAKFNGWFSLLILLGLSIAFEHLEQAPPPSSTSFMCDLQDTTLS